MNIALIFVVVLFLLGAIFLVIGLVAMLRSKAAQTWPTITGTVLSSDVIRHEDSDSEGGSTITYEPVVVYQYNIMGQPYTGKRIAFGANRFDYKKANEIASLYPVGARVQVHYNPDKPTTSTLEVTAKGGKLFLILGAVLLFAAVVLLILTLVL